MLEKKCAACAKLNLTLDILGKRPDGYHEMCMVMQTISLCDLVTIRETEEGFTLRTDGDFLAAGKKTLEEQAVQAFFAALGRPAPGFCVTLEKITPAYAGLGGGSADVAALLRVLRQAYAPQMPLEQLESIGAQVGSDVPFCIRGGTALVRGRGEKLESLPPMPACWLVICKPDFGIPTPELFACVQADALQKRPDTEGMCSALFTGDLSGIARCLGNVFEEVLPQRYHQVFSIVEQLRALGALNAAMSGSGPSVFGIFAQAEDALFAAEQLKRTYAQTFLARPVPAFLKSQ